MNDGICTIDAFSCEDDCSKCCYYEELVTLEVQVRRKDIDTIKNFIKCLEFAIQK